MAVSKYAIGVDIGGTKTSVSLWTTAGELLAKSLFKTEGGSAEVLDAIAAAAAGLLEGARVPKSSVLGLGISCGGPLDSARGLILGPPNLPGWDSVPVVALLEERTGLPCRLENDANACALAEWYWGAGRGCDNMVFLTFGTGLGAGLILDGRLYRGVQDLAGEVGHVRVAEEGPLGYGKRGSWEGLCSGGGIARLYEEETGRRSTTKEICEEARAGLPEAMKVIERSAFYLGRGAAMLIDILNPERIVIGSVFARSEELFRPVMEAVIAQEALAPSASRCSILPAQLGEELGDRAALGVIMNTKEMKT